MATKSLWRIALFLAALLVLKAVMPTQEGPQFATQDEQNRYIAKLNGVGALKDFVSTRTHPTSE